MLELCDYIRGNDIKPREAVTLIKKTLDNPNPHQQYFAYWKGLLLKKVEILSDFTIFFNFVFFFIM